MKRKVTMKQRKFVKAVVKSIGDPSNKTTPSEIYQQVYDVKEGTGNDGSSRLLKDTVVQEHLLVEIEKAYPPAILRANLDKLLRSTKSVYYEGRKVGSDPDNGIRLETLRTILKVIGAYKDKPTTIDNRTVNFYLQADQIEGLKAIATRLDDINSRLLGTTS